MVDKDVDNPQGPSSNRRDNEPDPEDSKPGPKDGVPGPKDSQSGPKDSKSGPKDSSKPEPKDSVLGSKDSVPGPNDSQSGNKDGEPGFKDSDNHPGTKHSKLSPEDSSDSDSKDSKPGPKDSGPGPKNSVPDPKDIQPGPKDSVAGSKDIQPGPKDSAAGPKDIQPGPKDSVHDRDSEDPIKSLDLDDILINELGQFGRFQLYNLLLVTIPIMMAAFMSDYIFSAAAIPHRCLIPECGESNKDHLFKPEWVLNAIPAASTSSGFSSCERFVPANNGINGSLNYCPANLFTDDTVDCVGFVYARDISVVYDFNLGCQEWLRALAGTFSNIGCLLVLPIIGFISDRFGRKLALILSAFNLSLIGTLKVFSVNYGMYLTLQMLQTTLGAGTYSSAYIFAAELVGPKFRVFTGATVATIFAAGLIILGLVAWAVQYWRHVLLTLHIPCFIVISYYWLLPESVRWLISKEKWPEVKEILERVALVNKKHISENSMRLLMNPPPQTTKKIPNIITIIYNSRVMLRRVCTTPVWWITTTFVYYGLSINSTSLSDTMYLNFILTVAVEIPGYYTSLMVLDIIGRKATLSAGFIFSALCNIAFAFIPKNLGTVRLVLFLMGKFGISVVFTSLYLFTSELYPTQYRHRLLAFSSMIGRIGSITAPLTPVLNKYVDGLASLLFGAMAMLSGILVLTQPETLGCKMPDTLAQAEALGTARSKKIRLS